MSDTMRAPHSDQAARALADELRGTVLRPGDEGYDDARAIWNGMIDRRPALIAQCEGTSDVIAALGFARKHGLEFSVRAGGHNVSGRAICEDGLVIDLTRMNDIHVDPMGKTARVGAGATWGEFDVEAQAFGLATTGGVHPGTGVAGLTLGGGIGFLARTCGLATDNVISMDVVLADGTLVRASEDENPDLFWALRGGSGAFGVATSFQFRLHDVGPEVLVAQLFYPYDQARDALRAYRDFGRDAPDEVGCYGLFLKVPPVAPFPEEHHGATCVALVASYAGDIAAGREVLRPLAEHGAPMLKVVDPMPYAALQSAFKDGSPDGVRYYFKSVFIEELTDAAIDTIVERIANLPGEFTQGGFEPMGGAINRKDASATAYPHRNAAFNFSVFSGWTDPSRDDEIIVWTRDFHRAMEPHGMGGVYVNYLDRDDLDRVANAYGPNFERLKQVKRAYDPENLFRFNQSLGPAMEHDASAS